MILKLGSRGDAVRELQKALQIRDDGVFGKDTVAAVGQFQREHQIIVDGKAGPITITLAEKLPSSVISKAAAGAARLWPHEDDRSLTAFYGNPRGSSGTVNAAWAGAHLAAIAPPWRMVASWDTNDIINHFPFHNKCKPALDAILLSLWEQCDRSQEKIEAAGLHLFGGSFNYRPIRGGAGLSCHARAIALDINPEENQLGAQWNPHTMPEFVVKTFKDADAQWGGDFAHRKDTMHFQFAWD